MKSGRNLGEIRVKTAINLVHEEAVEVQRGEEKRGAAHQKVVLHLIYFLLLFLASKGMHDSKQFLLKKWSKNGRNGRKKCKKSAFFVQKKAFFFPFFTFTIRFTIRGQNG